MLIATRDAPQIGLVGRLLVRDRVLSRFTWVAVLAFAVGVLWP